MNFSMWQHYFQNPSWRKTGYGLLALIGYVMCGITGLGVLFSVMLFDSPQSAHNPVIKIVLGLILAGPFVFWGMQSHAIRGFMGEQPRALFTLILPTLWSIAITVAFFVVG